MYNNKFGLPELQLRINILYFYNLVLKLELFKSWTCYLSKNQNLRYQSSGPPSWGLNAGPLLCKQTSFILYPGKEVKDPLELKHQ